MIAKIFSFLKSIISSHTKESSKRLGFIWTMFLLTISSIWVCIVGSATEILILIGSLITFASTLAGISSYQSNKIVASKPKEEV